MYNYVYKKTFSNSISCLLSISIGVIIYSIGILVFKIFSIEEVKGKVNKRFRKHF